MTVRRSGGPVCVSLYPDYREAQLRSGRATEKLFRAGIVCDLVSVELANR